MDPDMHAMEPHDPWSSHLEPCFRDRALRILRGGGARLYGLD